MLFLVMLISSCGIGDGKELNERVTIWRKDKIPYGTFYAYEQLPVMFPNAEILIDKESPDSHKNIFQPKNNELEAKLSSHVGRTASFVFTHQVLPNSSELRALLDFVYEGNQLFLSSFEFSDELLDSLKLETNFSNGQVSFNDSLLVSITNPESKIEESYSYPGKSYDNYFSGMDSGFTTVLGWDHDGNANFVKISYDNGGAFYLHLAPLAFSNFFLLHKENKRYYDCALSNMPKDLELIVWGEYFRHHTNGDEGRGSGGSTGRIFNWMMSQEALAWALSMLLLLFLIIFLFESKRRQRVIPIRKPLQNASLDFVKTIGNLYYQRHDNKNLVAKMTAHFMDHVRNRYNIPTSRMDEDFEKKLSYKTGIDLQTIHDIVYQAKYLADQTSVSDVELLLFNQQLQNFYKPV
jgi:hypothetical protein